MSNGTECDSCMATQCPMAQNVTTGYPMSNGTECDNWLPNFLSSSNVTECAQLATQCPMAQNVHSWLPNIQWHRMCTTGHWTSNDMMYTTGYPIANGTECTVTTSYAMYNVTECDYWLPNFQWHRMWQLATECPIAQNVPNWLANIQWHRMCKSDWLPIAQWHRMWQLATQFSMAQNVTAGYRMSNRTECTQLATQCLMVQNVHCWLTQYQYPMA